MSCDNCDCTKCKRARNQSPTKLTRDQLSSADRYRYSDPNFWCQCGAWKYNDAPCCEECWKEREAYIDR